MPAFKIANLFCSFCGRVDIAACYKKAGKETYACVFCMGHVPEPYDCPLTDAELAELSRLARKASAHPWQDKDALTADDLFFASVARGAIPRLVNELRKLKRQDPHG